MTGSIAPAFTAITDQGASIALEDFKNRWVVLYFYPKDSTPGCSIEASKFEQALPELEALGATVIGVSTNGTGSHAKFRERCDLSFALLPDTDKAISRAYGVLGGLLGILGIADRQTFLIDPHGKIVHHWRRVSPLTHATEVLRELEARVKLVSPN